MMDIGHVPECFNQSYTVPIPNRSCNVHSKSVTVNDFRGISISPDVSKVLELIFWTAIAIFLQLAIVNLVSNKMLSYRRETALQGASVLAKSGRLELADNILRTL